MKLPVTIKGFVSLLKKIERQGPESLKGFNNLSQNQQDLLKDLDAELSNYINEFDNSNNNQQEERK